ncbi:MAG: hypothetical protein WCF25_07290, partial [Acidimicrobiales bacterium]
VFTSAQIIGTVFGGLILTLVAPRTVFQIAGIVTTVFAVVLGPFALRATRSAVKTEMETQGA